MREISDKNMREKRLPYVKKTKKWTKKRFTHTFFFIKKMLLTLKIQSFGCVGALIAPSHFFMKTHIHQLARRVLCADRNVASRSSTRYSHMVTSGIPHPLFFSQKTYPHTHTKGKFKDCRLHNFQLIR